MLNNLRVYTSAARSDLLFLQRRRQLLLLLLLLLTLLRQHQFGHLVKVFPHEREKELAAPDLELNLDAEVLNLHRACILRRANRRADCANAQRNHKLSKRLSYKWLYVSPASFESTRQDGLEHSRH